MRRVTGIGGISFHAAHPVALRAWYLEHLGIDVQAWGGTAFTWADAAGNPTRGTTVRSIGAPGGRQFAPSRSTFTINYRVEDLAGLLQALPKEACIAFEQTDDSEFGKLGWVMDPQGKKVEPWRPDGIEHAGRGLEGGPGGSARRRVDGGRRCAGERSDAGGTAHEPRGTHAATPSSRCPRAAGPVRHTSPG